MCPPAAPGRARGGGWGWLGIAGDGWVWLGMAGDRLGSWGPLVTAGDGGGFCQGCRAVPWLRETYETTHGDRCCGRHCLRCAVCKVPER